MRIVVLGATGNVGTAVLHRLQAADEVSSIVGVSRRGPDRAGAPYDGVEWHRLDVAEPTAAGRLREIVAGAPGHLVPGGWLLLEHGWDQGPAIRTLLEQRGFVEVATVQDLEQRDRVTLGRLPR